MMLSSGRFQMYINESHTAENGNIITHNCYNAWQIIITTHADSKAYSNAFRLTQCVENKQTSNQHNCYNGI